MHTEICNSRNWATWPTWLQKVECVPGALQAMEMVSEPFWYWEGTSVKQVKNWWSTCKEGLGKSPLDCNSYHVKHFSKPLTYPFLLTKRSAWDEMLRWFLGYITHNLLRSLASEKSAHKKLILISTYWFW